MSTASAKSALDDFISAFSDQNDATKQYLAQQASPIATAATKTGDKLGEKAYADDALFTGVTDPDTIALLTEDLQSIGADIVGKVIQENVGNKLGRIFEEARSATFNLFGVGPDFFFDTVSRQSKSMVKAIADCAQAGVILQGEAVAYNTLHQTMNRADLDNLDPNQADHVRQACLDALNFMTATRVTAEKTGNTAGPLGVIRTVQKQVITPNGNILTDPFGNFIRSEVKPGDKLTFVTVAGNLMRPGSVPSVQATTFQVVTVISDTQITVAPPMVAETAVEYVIESVGTATVGALRAMDGICTFFTNPSGIIAVLTMEQLLKRIDEFDRLVNVIINLKDQFANAVSNVINGNFAGPITRTIKTVESELADDHEKLKILLDRPNFDKFSVLTLIRKLCAKACVLNKSLTNTPQTNKAAIQASPNYTPVNVATANMAAQSNGPALTYLAFSPKYRQTVQTINVQDVRPQLAARTADLITKIAAVQAWLVAQGAILATVPVVTDALAGAARDLLDTSVLDRSSDLVKANNLQAFAQASSNAASKAGHAAQEIGTVIEDLPVSDSDKFGALSDVRNSLIAIEEAQLFASESIQDETPEAIADVDTLTQQVSKIKERATTLLNNV